MEAAFHRRATGRQQTCQQPSNTSATASCTSSAIGRGTAWRPGWSCLCMLCAEGATGVLAAKRLPAFQCLMLFVSRNPVCAISTLLHPCVDLGCVFWPLAVRRPAASRRQPATGAPSGGFGASTRWPRSGSSCCPSSSPPLPSCLATGAQHAFANCSCAN